MAPNFTFHTPLIIQQWQCLQSLLNSASSEVTVDGLTLNVPQIVFISRYAGNAQPSASSIKILERSYLALKDSLANGEIIYGVNTGFGASADTRSKQLEAVQRGLTRELAYGVLPPDPHDPILSRMQGRIASWPDFDLELEDSVESQYMPWTWVRTAILLRMNSLMKGCSGIRPVIVETLASLLKHEIVPMIPLRGSISASGDLNPLAYISGTIQGKSTIRVLSRPQEDKNLHADKALAEAGVKAIQLQAKEGLAIVNGTAMSAACAVHGLHDAHQLAMLAQILTAMSVEALLGTPESFHPFFAENRPHPGQIESARNILAFLQDSKLARTNDGTDGLLRQDRYSIRTAAQWIGPALEDLLLAHQQLAIECNSATDNPLMNGNGVSLHGGNFQAKAVTAATEKIRGAMQSIGRMIFIQCQELINHNTSRGLSPNLVAEEPNQSAIFKGIDIYIAALFSELGFLANPVNHVQNAEMGNQALNSLALISSRYTATSIRVLSELAAAHLLTICQALDLRTLQLQFFDACRSQVSVLIESVLYKYSTAKTPASAADGLERAILAHLAKSMDATVTMLSEDRFDYIARTARDVLMDHPFMKDILEPLVVLQEFAAEFSSLLHNTWCVNRDAFILRGEASPYLGKGSKKLYDFVRRGLGVPFMCTARILTPEPEHAVAPQRNGAGVKNQMSEAPTVGTYTSIIYRAIRRGEFMPVMLELLQECVGSDELVR